MENQFVSCSRILRSAPRITEAIIERRPDLVMLGLDDTCLGHWESPYQSAYIEVASQALPAGKESVGAEKGYRL